MKYPILLALFALGCSPDNPSESVVEATDSLGWRYAHINEAGLSFRYPSSRADSVIDRYTPQCTSAQPIYQEGPDSLVDGAIIISSAPASFETTANLFGFERPNLAWQLKQGNEWFTHDTADSLRVGAWRGLVGTMTILGYFNDFPDSLRSPDDDPNATLPKESLYQTRFFAMRHIDGQCAAVISWRGQPVSEYHGGLARASWDTASLQHMLRRARLHDNAERN
jgi:hypothetical protein